MTSPTLDRHLRRAARVYRVVRPTPLLRHPLLGRRDRPRHPRQAREPQPDRRLQGSRRPQPDRQPVGERAPRRDHRDDRQSRAVDRAGVPARRRAVHDRRRRSATTRRRTRRCAPTAPTLIEFGRDFDEARERVEQLQHERGLRYVHSANEPLLDRRRRHLRARDLRGAAGRRRHPGADRRRQRRVRLRDRADADSAAAPGSSASRPSAPTRSRARGAAAERVRRRDGRHVRRRDGDARRPSI